MEDGRWSEKDNRSVNLRFIKDPARFVLLRHEILQLFDLCCIRHVRIIDCRQPLVIPLPFSGDAAVRSCDPTTFATSLPSICNAVTFPIEAAVGATGPVVPPDDGIQLQVSNPFNTLKDSVVKIIERS